MQEEQVLRLHEGMTVEDADGDKVGTVKGIVQPAAVVMRTADTTVQSGGEVYLKVHVGLPLLGKTYYIPSSAIRDVTPDRVILVIDESKLGDQGWDQRPAGIED